jgi:hypothetical protein
MEDKIQLMKQLQDKVKAFDEKEIKNSCDLCGTLDEILVEKPLSSIVNGELFVNHRPKPIWVCLDCLKIETENL